MKARVVGVDRSLGALLGAELVGVAALAALPVHRFGWWPAAAVTVAAGMAALVTVHRRSAAGWAIARVRWRRARCQRAPVGAAVDIGHGGAAYGVRTGGEEAVTVVAVDGRAYSPTFLRGSTVSHTDNVVPLPVLIGLLEQPGGLHLRIDVVSAGYRVRPASGYPQLYSTLLADRGAAGQRATYLIVRLAIAESLPGLRYRRSIGSAAAAATERIVRSLQQQGIRARGLGAEEHDAVLAELSAGLAAAPTRPAGPDHGDPGDAASVASSRAHRGTGAARSARRRRARPKAGVGWRSIDANPGQVTSYYFSAEDITTASFHRMWALRSDHVVHVTMLRKQPGGPVTVSALVRTTDPRPPQQPPTLFLNPLPGDQYAAALRAAPTSRPRLKLPARRLDAPQDLQIPIGPTGILVGTALRDDESWRPQIRRDDLVMLALTDRRQPTRIAMHTSEFYVRQLLIRAAATGERIAVYAADPSRWYPVSQPHIAVVEPGRPAEFVATIIVNDRARHAPSAGLSSTVITLGPRPADTAAPDILFQQTSDSAVRITTATRTLEVAMVVFRQEQAWTG